MPGRWPVRGSAGQLDRGEDGLGLLDDLGLGAGGLGGGQRLDHLGGDAPAGGKLALVMPYSVLQHSGPILTRRDRPTVRWVLHRRQAPCTATIRTCPAPSRNFFVSW